MPKRRITDRLGSDNDWKNKVINTRISCKILVTPPAHTFYLREDTDELVWDETRKMTWKKVLEILTDVGIVEPDPELENAWLKKTEAFNTPAGKEADDIESIVKDFLAKRAATLDLSDDEDLKEYLSIKLIEIFKIYEKAGQFDSTLSETIPELVDVIFVVVRENIPQKQDRSLTKATMGFQIVSLLTSKTKLSNIHLIHGLAKYSSRVITTGAYNHASFQQKTSKSA